MTDPLPFPDNMTHGEKYKPAMSIANQGEADRYFAACVEHTMRVAGESPEEAERIERMNLGFIAGYYDGETRARVERLFRCAHPVFGPIAEVRPPTPADIQRTDETIRGSKRMKLPARPQALYCRVCGDPLHDATYTGRRTILELRNGGVHCEYHTWACSNCDQTHWQRVRPAPPVNRPERRD